MVKDPFGGKFTKLSAIPGTTVIPNEKGTDLYSKDDSYDAHIRIERIGKEKEMIIDVFKSKTKDPKRAYVESQSFSNDDTGAEEAQEFLSEYDIQYEIKSAN